MAKVLILEPNLIRRRTISQAVRKSLGYNVVDGKSGVDGIAAFSDGPPNVILLNLHMDEMNGVDFLTNIRKNEEYKEIPVILLTEDKRKDAPSEVRRLGIFDYLEGRFEMDELVKKVKYWNEKSSVAGGGSARKKFSDVMNKRIMIIEEDERFSRFFQNLVGQRLKLIDGKNSAQGLQLFRNLRPDIVCMGEELKVLNARLLAENIRKLDPGESVDLFLFAESGEFASEEESAVFKDVITKTYDKEQLTREFNKKALGIETLFDIIVETTDEIKENPNLLAREIFNGVLKIEFDDEPIKKFSDFKSDVYVVCEIKENIQFSGFYFLILGDQSDIRNIVNRVFKSKVAAGQSVTKLFGDFAASVFEGFGSLLSQKSVTATFEKSVVKTNVDELKQIKSVQLLPLRTEEEGDTFVCGFAVPTKS
jgi:CheY-like chemotaxis protein